MSPSTTVLALGRCRTVIADISRLGWRRSGGSVPFTGVGAVELPSTVEPGEPDLAKRPGG